MAQFFGRIEGAAGLHPVLGSQFDGILPQYFSTLSIDIAVHFRYRYSLVLFGIGNNTAQLRPWHLNLNQVNFDCA